MKIKLREGSIAKVKSINYQNAASKKLIDMGITPDTHILFKKIAPFGDPYIIEVRNYHLALRKNDLTALELEIIK